MYFQFQMFSIFWVWLTTLFENSVITNLVHLMLLLKLPNLHILFYITSPACVMVHRLLQLCNYYLFLFFDGSGSLQSCFPDIFLCLNVVLTLHQLFMNRTFRGFSENYTCLLPKERMSIHWNQKQATVYPILVLWKVDGILREDHLTFISNNLTHYVPLVELCNAIIHTMMRGI